MFTIKKMLVAGIISTVGLLTMTSVVAQEPGLTSDTIKIGIFGP